MKQFVKLDKIEECNDVSKLRTFFSKIETTVRNLKSPGIETPSYGSLLILVLTSKLPADLRTLFARRFIGNVWLLDELLVTLKNGLEAKEDRLVPEIHILKGVNFVDTGALLLLFTVVVNLLKATVFFVVALIVILIDAQK